jgi:hypothetical protein
LTLQPTRLGPVAPTVAESVLVWLSRIVALYCLLFGVLYWIRLIGVNDGMTWRFDTMPVYWQAAAVSLAVFFPFAAIGLWMLASWGPVIWAICAVTETVMYAGFPDLFGARQGAILTHGLVALFYAVVRLVIYLQKRRAS